MDFRKPGSFLMNFVGKVSDARIISVLNLLFTICWFGLFYVLYGWSSRPCALSRISHTPQRAYQQCGLVRIISIIFLFLYSFHFSFLERYIPDDSIDKVINEFLPFNFNISRVIAFILVAGAIGLFIPSLFASFPEFIIPRLEQDLFKGIYTRTRHPQALCVMLIFHALALWRDSLTLLLYAILSILPIIQLVNNEEEDLIFRFQKKYIVYKRIVPTFFPILNPLWNLDEETFKLEKAQEEYQRRKIQKMRRIIEYLENHRQEIEQDGFVSDVDIDDGFEIRNWQNNKPNEQQFNNYTSRSIPNYNNQVQNKEYAQRTQRPNVEREQDQIQYNIQNEDQMMQPPSRSRNQIKATHEAQIQSQQFDLPPISPFPEDFMNPYIQNEIITPSIPYTQQLQQIIPTPYPPTTRTLPIELQVHHSQTGNRAPNNNYNFIRR